MKLTFWGAAGTVTGSAHLLEAGGKLYLLDFGTYHGRRKEADELHRQYVLGFTPKVLDGKVHQLEVRVKQPGMTVRARKTYLATKDVK